MLGGGFAPYPRPLPPILGGIERRGVFRRGNWGLPKANSLSYQPYSIVLPDSPSPRIGGRGPSTCNMAPRGEDIATARLTKTYPSETPRPPSAG